MFGHENLVAEPMYAIIQLLRSANSLPEYEAAARYGGPSLRFRWCGWNVTQELDSLSHQGG